MIHSPKLSCIFTKDERVVILWNILYPREEDITKKKQSNSNDKKTDEKKLEEVTNTNFKCNVCYKSFKRQKTLIFHKKRHEYKNKKK